MVTLRKASEHGLGLYRAPVARRAGWFEPWPEWIDEVWRRAIAAAEGSAAPPTPEWYAVPAVSQAKASTPQSIAPFAAFNASRDYAQQVTPFGFLLLGHADPMAPAPPALVPGRVTPMAPYSTDPGALLQLPWRNRRDGRAISVTTSPRPRPGAVRLRTFGDVVRDHLAHPEAKSGDPRGGSGRRGSRGVLSRLTVRSTGAPAHIGKESNRLEEVADGLVDDSGDVYLEYRDERREWEAVLPALRIVRDDVGWRHLSRVSGLSERALRYALNGGKIPHRVARESLMAEVGAPIGSARGHSRPSRSRP